MNYMQNHKQGAKVVDGHRVCFSRKDSSDSPTGPLSPVVSPFTQTASPVGPFSPTSSPPPSPAYCPLSPGSCRPLGRSLACPPLKLVESSNSFSLNHSYPIYKRRIFFMVCESRKNAVKAGFISFCTDETFLYYPFCDDFGPLNLGNIYRFCEELADILSKSHRPLLLYTCDDPRYTNNSAFLLAAFMVRFSRSLSQQPPEHSRNRAKIRLDRTASALSWPSSARLASESFTPPVRAQRDPSLHPAPPLTLPYNPPPRARLPFPSPPPPTPGRLGLRCWSSDCLPSRPGSRSARSAPIPGDVCACVCAVAQPPAPLARIRRISAAAASTSLLAPPLALSGSSGLPTHAPTAPDGPSAPPPAATTTTTSTERGALDAATEPSTLALANRSLSPSLPLQSVPSPGRSCSRAPSSATTTRPLARRTSPSPSSTASAAWKRWPRHWGASYH